jgi:ATP/maltotriose-dependent transcriptional regulator MalT
MRLLAERPARAADLHRRACAWLQQESLVVEAAEHAAAAGDHEVLARLLDDRHLLLIRNGRARTLQRYVRRLPEDVLARHASLAAATAVAAAMIGHATLERRRLLSLADRGLEQAGPDAAHVEATVGMVRAATLEPDVPRAVEAGARAVEVAVAGADDVSVAAFGAYSRALFFAGDLVAAWAAGMAAIEHPAADRRPPGHAFARASLALTAVERGHVGSARHHAEKARQIVGRTHAARTWLGANAAVAMGAVLAAEGRLEEAEAELAHAEPLFRDEVATIHHAWLLVVLARIRLRRGRLDAAAAHLREADQELAQLGDCGIVPALAELAAGELAQAREHADPGPPLELPSGAELPVLRLLPSELSASGIAAALFLSPNTVRSHMKSIYRKLNVRSRADAVARAEAAGLLVKSDSPG